MRQAIGRRPRGGGEPGLSTSPEIVETGVFEEAVRMAFTGATPGTTVLLSPACASFDLFRNYEAPGEAFHGRCPARILRRQGCSGLGAEVLVQGVDHPVEQQACSSRTDCPGRG